MKVPFLKEGARLNWECFNNGNLARSGIVTVEKIRSSDFIVTREGLTEKGKPARMYCSFPINKEDGAGDTGMETVQHIQKGEVTENSFFSIFKSVYTNKDTKEQRIYETRSVFTLA